MTTAVPSTPHNQKANANAGPVPNLISTLRCDNRDQLLSLLSLDPHSNDISISPPLTPNNNDLDSKSGNVSTSASAAAGNNNTTVPRVAHRQRLIFATDSMRKLLLYHTLFQPDHHQTNTNKKKKSGNRSGMTKTSFAHLTHDELALGLDAYNPYGIVNTRILFPNNNNSSNTSIHPNTESNQQQQDDRRNNTYTSTTTSMQGTETIYNPAASSPVKNNPSSLFNIHHDLIQDNDGISTILYFILPLPEHVKAVSKVIQGYTHQYNNNNSNNNKKSFLSSSSSLLSRRGKNPNNDLPSSSILNAKIKHRIVFLTRCTKLCTQILYNENILPSPEYNNDNLSNHTQGSTSTSNAASGTGSNHHNVLVNVQKNIVVHTLDIDLIPIEDDILTLLDSSSVMKDVSSIHGVPSMYVNCVASSIMKIQTIANGMGDSTTTPENEGDDVGNCGGYIPRIQSFGKVSESILKRCFDLRREEYYDVCMSSNKDAVDLDGYSGGDHHAKSSSGDVQAMMILDRRVDLVTPMLTPLTYEGLLDDVLSIESGILHVKTNIIDPPEDETENDTESSKNETAASALAASKQKKKQEKEKPLYTLLPLNDQDTLYVEVRDQHVEKFGSFLQEQAKALKESHANFSNKDKDLNQIHMFVKQIPIFTQNLKSLTHHIHLAELIKHTTIQSEFRQRWQLERSIVESESCFDVIEDLIASQYNVWRVLRLLCLNSLTNGGVKTSKLDTLKREIVQTYGYEFVFLLQNLESIGLLRKKDTLWDTASSSGYSIFRKQLQLIQPDVDPLNPDDVSYVSSGYAPISARIIQTAMKGWSGKEDTLKELPGRGIDIEQKFPPEEYTTAIKRNTSSPLGTWAKQLKMNQDTSSVNEGKQKKPILLVYFVGGITYAEIAALRFMSKRSSFPFSIVCCTTKIINGTSFLQSLA